MVELSQREVDAFLAERNIANLVTVRSNGRPHVAPVWYMCEGDRAFVIADGNAVKMRNIRHNPVVVLSVANNDWPYRYVVMDGEAKVTTDHLVDMATSICIRYVGPERGPALAQELITGGHLLVDIHVIRVTSRLIHPRP